jgi:hypothetical protein
MCGSVSPPPPIVCEFILPFVSYQGALRITLLSVCPTTFFTFLCRPNGRKEADEITLLTVSSATFRFLCRPYCVKEAYEITFDFIVCIPLCIIKYINVVVNTTVFVNARFYHSYHCMFQSVWLSSGVYLNMYRRYCVVQLIKITSTGIASCKKIKFLLISLSIRMSKYRSWLSKTSLLAHLL